MGNICGRRASNKEPLLQPAPIAGARDMVEARVNKAPLPTPDSVADEKRGAQEAEARRVELVAGAHNVYELIWLVREDKLRVMPSEAAHLIKHTSDACSLMDAGIAVEPAVAVRVARDATDIACMYRHGIQIAIHTALTYADTAKDIIIYRRAGLPVTAQHALQRAACVRDMVALVHAGFKVSRCDAMRVVRTAEDVVVLATGGFALAAAMAGPFAISDHDRAIIANLQLL